jgi:hypothetical protein
MRALWALLLVAGTAHADSEPTEWSPSVLGNSEVRIGPGTAGIGLLDRFEVDTHPIVYTALAAGGSAYDVHGKLMLVHTYLIDASIGAGITSIAFGDGAPDMPNTDTLKIRAIPVEGWASVHPVPRVRLSAGTVYTDIDASGHTSMDFGRLTGIGGTFSGSNVELYGAAQVRVARKLYAIAGVRTVVWEASDIEMSPDGGGKANAGDRTAAEGAWAASVAVHLTDTHFNLRLGLEYGNYHVPLLNLVTPDRGWMPVLDVYWRI